MGLIELDDEVLLSIRNARKPGESDNDVVRRIFGLSGSRPTVIGRDRHGSRAKTIPELVDTGHLRVGDELIWRRKGRDTVHAQVESDWWISVAGLADRFDKPSAPLTRIAGHEVNGWVQWRVARTGETLHELRLKAQVKGAD